jgi:hypothetical protein
MSSEMNVILKMNGNSRYDRRNCEFLTLFQSQPVNDDESSQ